MTLFTSYFYFKKNDYSILKKDTIHALISTTKFKNWALF